MKRIMNMTIVMMEMMMMNNTVDGDENINDNNEYNDTDL